MSGKRNDWDVTPGCAGGFPEPYLRVRDWGDDVLGVPRPGIAGHEISRSEAEALQRMYSTGGEGMMADDPATDEGDWAEAKGRELMPNMARGRAELVAALRWAKRNGKAEGLWEAARQAMRHGRMLLGAKGDMALPHFRELATSLNAQAAAEANEAPVMVGNVAWNVAEGEAPEPQPQAARRGDERVVMGSREREGAAYMPERGDEIAPTADVLRASLSLYDQPLPVHEPRPEVGDERAPPEDRHHGALRWLVATGEGMRLQQWTYRGIGQPFAWWDVPMVNEVGAMVGKASGR
jgi:hypothetical protein